MYVFELLLLEWRLIIKCVGSELMEVFKNVDVIYIMFVCVNDICGVFL